MTRAALALVVLMVAGCADQRSDSGPVAGTDARSTDVAAATSSPPDCAAGRVPVLWNDQLAPTSAICVRTGTEIVINLYPPQQHQWSTPTSSDQTVAAVATSAASQEGVMAATVEAQRTGTAAISAVAKAMDGAPDPGSTQWRLVITVVT